ncbi:hypothetical protein [Serinicoccus hydrothermalis]|uniref:hypothetical protein n=1 Tax=Serinicoccus hydrothermalis TaxID=1758689 RepID=UPI0012F9E5C3|nr:hypothetical protein [Serinicoccus hydrothermalis]
MTGEQVRSLSHADFVAALRAAQGEGTGATRVENNEVLLPEGSAPVYLDGPGIEEDGSDG